MLVAATAGFATAQPLTIGSKAPEFSLKDTTGADVSLKTENANGPVVLIVLRGFPGYQCPFCTKQFADLLAHADDFAQRKAEVLLVYPGAADSVKQHADEFLANRPMPANFHFLVDPNMEFITAHNLRWIGDKETSYPSTFVIDRTGEIRYAASAKAHGSRVPSAQVLEALGPVKKGN